jgi:glycine oxidase
MPAQGTWREADPRQTVERHVPDLNDRELDGEAYDAVVVGAGVIGLTCAWHAAAAGHRVCVVERDRVGAGASGVAAGMLAPVGEAVPGEERLLEQNLKAAKAYPEFVARLESAAGMETGYRADGALHVALDRDEAEELRRRHEQHRSLGLASEWLTPSRCRELEPGLSPSCAGGVLAPDEASIDPRRLLAALAVALEKAGVPIHEGAEVTAALPHEGGMGGVRLADGREIHARWTVLAAGAWSAAKWLPDEGRPAVRPVKGQVLRLRGRPGSLPCSRIVASERVYMVPRADGELVVGATVEEQGFDDSVTAGGVLELLREAFRALPDIAELELVEASAGLRPATPDNLPLAGRGSVDGLIVATGHFRNGVLLAPAAAEAVVEAMVPERVTA